MTLNTIALELVPPNVERGHEYAVEEARKVARISAESGLAGQLKHVMIPGMIPEDDDRPVPMKPKLDVLDYWSTIKPELPGMHGLCTQVTAFMDEPSLGERLTTLGDAGFDGIVFVGVPRTMNDGEGSGVAPTDALSIYDNVVGNRGVILIPTREGESGRFDFKCNQGANFALTQLLYSDAIVGFLSDFAKNTDHRPEILLSFGFVPKVETRVAPEHKVAQQRYEVASAVSTPVRLDPPTTVPAVKARPSPGSTDPIRPVMVKTLNVKPGTAQVHTASLLPFSLSSAARAPEPAPAPEAAPLALAKVEPVPAPAPAPLAAPVKIGRSQAHGGWVIQVGAFSAEQEARQRLVTVKNKAASLLAGADLADGEQWTMPATIEDPKVLDEIGEALKSRV